MGAWRQFQDAFDSCVAAARTRRGTRTASEAEADVRQMGAALARAMPADWYPDDAQAGGKRRLLDALLAQASLSHAALPDNFAELLDEGLANRLRDRHQCLRLWDGHEEPSQADAGAAALSADGTRRVPATEEPPPGDTGAASAVAPPAESSQAQLPPPDDRMLFHFLDAPAGGGPAVSNSPPLPDRWRAMPAEERRRWLCRALTAYLQTCSRRGAALVLLVEPEVSPLLAYGIARLLPQPWRFRLRCSAAGAGLAGGPATGDPSDAAERVLDTWAAPGASFPATEGYAKLIWDDRLLLPDQAGAARRAARIDRWLQPWEQTRVEGLAQLQELACGEVAVRRMLAGAYDESQMAWTKSRRVREHVRRRIRQCLIGHPNVALMEGAARSPAVFRLVVDVALEAGDEIGCRAAIRSLVERVASLDSLEEALGPGPAARAFKLHALRHHVSTSQRLPHDCGWLWRERPSAGQDAQQPLLFDVLSSSRVTWDVIRASLDAVPAEGLGLLFCGVLVTQTTGPAKSEVLANLAARPEFDLIELLAHFGTDLWIHREDVQDVLAVRIEQMLDRLHAFPERFPSLAAVLETASRLCEGGERHQDLGARIKAWQKLRGILQAQRQRSDDRAARLLTKVGIRPQPDLRFAEEICECLDRAYPRETQAALRSRELASLAAFVVAVVREEGLAEQLPEGFPELLDHYFRRGKRGLQELQAYHEKRIVRLSVKQPAVIAAACVALVLLVAVVVSALRGCGDSPADDLADGASPAGMHEASEDVGQDGRSDLVVSPVSAGARPAPESGADPTVETQAAAPAARVPRGEASDFQPVSQAGTKESDHESEPQAPGGGSAKPAARAEEKEAFVLAASPLQETPRKNIWHPFLRGACNCLAEGLPLGQCVRLPLRRERGHEVLCPAHSGSVAHGLAYHGQSLQTPEGRLGRCGSGGRCVVAGRGQENCR